MLESPGPQYFKHPLIWPNTVEYRIYQKTIADAAAERNTLVILPTALGKTVILTIVAAQILYNYGDIKILIMAPTRFLVMQHRTSFTRLLRLRERDAVLLMGTTTPKYRRAVWEGEVQIFFSTPQVVRNGPREKRLTLEPYGLFVFHECHRAVKRYAYTAIAKFYISRSRYRLIFGITASPGSKHDGIQSVCQNLYIERIKYRIIYIHLVKIRPPQMFKSYYDLAI